MEQIQSARWKIVTALNQEMDHILHVHILFSWNVTTQWKCRSYSFQHILSVFCPIKHDTQHFNKQDWIVVYSTTFHGLFITNDLCIENLLVIITSDLYFILLFLFLFPQKWQIFPTNVKNCECRNLNLSKKQCCGLKRYEKCTKYCKITFGQIILIICTFLLTSVLLCLYIYGRTKSVDVAF